MFTLNLMTDVTAEDAFCLFKGGVSPVTSQNTIRPPFASLANPLHHVSNKATNSLLSVAMANSELQKQLFLSKNTITKQTSDPWITSRHPISLRPSFSSGSNSTTPAFQKQSFLLQVSHDRPRPRKRHQPIVGMSGLVQAPSPHYSRNHITNPDGEGGEEEGFTTGVS